MAAHAPDPEQQALLDAIFEHAPVGLVFWDRELRYRRINAALAAINGIDPAAHLGRTPREVLGEELGAEVERLIERALAGTAALDAIPLTGETRSQPGASRHWVASYYPVVDGEGRAVGVAGAVVEVTELRRAERERTTLLEDALSARAHAEAAQIRAEEARRAAEDARMRTELLAEAGRRMALSMDYETTLQEVAEISVPVIADWCAVTLREAGGKLRTVAVAHRDRALAARVRALAERAPSRLEELLREAGAGGSLARPMRTAGGDVGTLTLAMAESGRGFAPQDESLAAALASRAALHVGNAQLYTERSHIAKTLQASLLPRRLPEIPDLEVAGRYLAAGDQNDVGGDFYDVFPTDEDGVWAALIGDVTGKGPEAAALTSLVRHTLRAVAIRSADPLESLHVLNRAMLADTLSTRFCTVIYARICPSPGTALVTVATGGHLPPLLLRAGGTLERVDVRGSLVGGVEAPRFSARDVRLHAGDALILYTDGVTELRTRDPGYGERRLNETLRGLAGRDAGEIAAAVLRSAVALQAGPPRDDIAVLALRVAPGGAA